MAQPEGFDDGSGRMWKLKKALYGLKQAPRQWYLKLREVLEEIGFTPSSADHSLFMLGEGEQGSFMVVYVDDILIFSPSSDLVKEVMLKLQDKFKCKALGDVNFYLGLHIERDVEKRCMRVHQRKYLEALAANIGQSEGHFSTLFPSGFNSVKGPEEESVGEEERRCFHSLVAARMRVAKYLGQTATVGLQYSAAAQRCQKGADGVEPGRLFLTAFSDASYASESEDMTSVGGFICCVGGGPTAWESKKQVDQALSSMESEYMVLFRAAILHAHAAKEACRIAALTANQGVLCFMCLLFPSPLPPSLHHPLFPLPPLALFPLLSLSPSPTPPTILHAHAAKEACRIAALTAICDQAVPCLYPPLLPRPFPVTEHQAILQAQSAKEVCRIAALISILNAKTCAIARAKPRAVGSNQSAIVEVGEGG
ncbi:unnamed protein product [Closterium sp. NIES-54]